MQTFKINLKLDFWTIGIALILSLIGILFIYSSSSNLTNNTKYLKQITHLIIALVLYIIVANISYQKYITSAVLIYIIGIVLLLITLIFGSTINNQKGWIKLGIFHAQFSEFCKLSFIIAFAVFINNFQDQAKRFSFLVISFLIVLPYIILLALQPDMGTSLIFFFIFFVMLFMGGVNITFLVLLFGVSFISLFVPLLSYYLTQEADITNTFTNLIGSSFSLTLIGLILLLISGAAYVIYKYFFSTKNIFLAFLILITLGTGFIATNGTKKILKPYHYKRFLVFIHPEMDLAGKGYNTNQSKISIGSGELTGQGLTKGKQNRGQFLPAEDTDFIFSLVGEEWGFIGASIIMLLFFFLIYGGLQIAYSARDFPSSLIALGITSMYMGHVAINLFSAIGLFPVVGIPLPFMSYGGSSLLVNYIGLAILFNIKMKRFSYN